MLQPHGAHRPRESAGVQAALGLCWHHPQCGPAHRGRALSPASGRRPPLPSACTDRVVSPPTVCSPPPRGWRGSSHVPPVLPEGLSPPSTLCCCLGHRPWQKRVVRAGLWPLGARDTRTRLVMGPPEPSIFAMLQAASPGPGGDSQDLGRDQASVCLRVL